MTKLLKYKPINRTKFRDWTVISDEIKKNINRATYWKVRYTCGEKRLRNTSHLVNKKVSSCKSCAALKLPFEKSYLNKIKRRANSINFEYSLDVDYIISIFNNK